MPSGLGASARLANVESVARGTSFGSSRSCAENEDMLDRFPEQDSSPSRTPLVPSPDSAATPPEPVRTDTAEAEFAGFLSDLGARNDGEPAAPLDLKDVTIAALREILEGLRPIGDQLAESERRRADLEAQLEAAVCATHIERCAELEAELVKLRKTVVQAQTRLEKSRAKTAERQRVAAQRWREIQKLRSECTQLQRELRKKSEPQRDA